MHEHDDDELWTGQGSDGELAALERTLGTLRWQARELALSGEPGEAPVTALHPATVRRRSRSGAWVPVLTGVLTAAAMFALLVWLRPVQDVAPSPESIQPAGAPSPDLLDPFGPRQHPGSTAPPPQPQPQQPTAPTEPRKVSPDLKDPFANTDAPSDTTSPELKDPFAKSKPPPEPGGEVLDPWRDANDPPPPREQPAISDPFGSKPKSSKPVSPDLKDPFRRDN